MKITAVLMSVAVLHVSATSFSQTVTISGRRMTIDVVFRQLETQTGYSVLWNESLFGKDYTVDLNVKDAPIEKVMAACLDGLPLSFKITGRLITVQRIKQDQIPAEATINVAGIVRDEANGKPLASATVGVKGAKLFATTDVNGHFMLFGVEANATLVISFVGYQTKEYPLKGNSSVEIALTAKPTSLNQLMIIGYGTTSREKSTGSVTTIDAETIHDQPVSNPLMALQGQVPGMDVTMTSGRPGANISVFVRGTNSIGAGTDPLYIVDGVPFNSAPLNQFDFLGDPPVGDQSPFNSINPADIESITVLKDADATAIYGSRGANGVILITTKRGKYTAGKASVTADVYQGWGNVAHFLNMLNTRQYIALRKQAYLNDGLNYNDPSQSPPDLTLYSQTLNTDWQKILLGSTAHTTNAALRLESGTDQSRFTLGLTYRHESTVYPTSDADQRLAANMTYDFTSLNKRFGIQITNAFSYDDNALMSGDPALGITTVPNLAPYTSAGALNWVGVNYPVNNPLSVFYQPFNNTTNYLSSNAVVHYRVWSALDLKVSLGYNQMSMNQVNTFPSTSAAPSAYYEPFAQFGKTSMDNWIVEPQANYNIRLGEGTLTALAGSTLQRRTTVGDIDYGYDYTSDLLLTSPAAAGTTFLSHSYADYRYASGFGRLNYDWQDKYIVNVNVRRDGSSRFGPDKRWGTFSSVGAAWVFSKEGFMSNTGKWLSFGKLRGSYGTVGNDQIGDYQYSVNYSTPYVSAFQGTQPLVPENLANNLYSWELDRKLDVGLDLGFADNRVNFTADWYRNRTGNQLVGYTLPAITGFTSVQYNLPAVVQNKGFEFQVSSTNIKSKNFTWRTSLNLTIPKNTLLRFPGLAASSYSYYLSIGQSLHVVKGYQLLRIDSTGNPVYLSDKNGNAELTNLGNTDPKFFGGLTNTVSYKNWTLTFMFQVDKKDGYNYLSSTFYPIGSEQNWDNIALQAWTTPGQKTMVPKATTASNSWSYYATSSATFGDASFVRLKNLYLSYDLPAAQLAKIGINKLAIYAQGYNVFTITRYRGLDPETGGIFTPVIRTFTGGIQLSF